MTTYPLQGHGGLKLQLTLGKGYTLDGSPDH